MTERHHPQNHPEYPEYPEEQNQHLREPGPESGGGEGERDAWSDPREPADAQAPPRPAMPGTAELRGARPRAGGPRGTEAAQARRGAASVAGTAEEEYEHPFFDLPPLERSMKKIQKKLRPDEEIAGKKPELWKILTAVLLCMLFAMGSYLVGKVYGATLIPDEPILIENPETPTAAEVPAPEEEEQGPQILSILLMGTDQREKNEMDRADVIILAAMNLDTQNISMISIPRDTRAQIADTDKTTRINHAHSTGGPELTVKTVENLLGVNVHYYVETNFNGFSACIDILGGVDYEVERRMYLPEEGIDLMPGQQNLNGSEALQYVRWRGDPTADIGRVGRQQKFIKALLEQSARAETLPKLPDLISNLLENVKTDMSSAQILNLAARFADVSKLSFSSGTLPGEAKTIGGAAYWVMDETAVRELITGVYMPPVPESEADADAEAEAEADVEAEADADIDAALEGTGETDAAE